MLDTSFVEKIEQLAQDQERTVEIGGLHYAFRKDGGLSLIEPPAPQALTASTLQSVIDYVTKDTDVDLIQIESPTSVEVYRAMTPNTNRRHKMLSVGPNIPEFTFGRYYDQESFIIALQAKFKPTEPLVALLKIVGNLIAEESVQQQDDGVSQRVVAKAGIAKVEVVNMEPRVTLAPYRSFPEVEPVASDFILRMRKEGNGIALALFEADGGAWQIEQIARIRAFLDEHRPAGVTIIA